MPLVVRLCREPFSPFIQIINEITSSSEELEIDEALEWFRVRGANMAVVEKALDHVWNLYGKRRPIRITISNPKEPAISDPRIDPRV